MFTTKQAVEVGTSTGLSLPPTCVVLGSGWNEILSKVETEQEISFTKLFGVGASVPGHVGKLVVGKIKGKRVAFMAGRFHTYEGYTSEEASRYVAVLAALGMKRLVLTAAAGALNEKYAVGDFIILSDLITTFCPSPLTGPEFIDLSQVFDPQWRLQAIAACAKHSLPFHEGVYVYTRGPHFETPADKMLLRQLGADVVGMSSVPEAIRAKSVGIATLGLAYVTNLAFVKHDHKDVLAAAEAGSRRMVSLLEEIV